MQFDHLGGDDLVGATSQSPFVISSAASVRSNIKIEELDDEDSFPYIESASRGGEAAPSLVFDERVHGVQDQLPTSSGLSSSPSRIKLSPGAGFEFEISSTEGTLLNRNCCIQSLVVGTGLLGLLITGGLFFFLFPMNTTPMVVTCFFFMVLAIALSLYHLLATPLLDVRATLYRMHLRLFIVVNLFFFAVNHLDFLQTHMRMLSTLNDKRTLESCSTLECTTRTIVPFSISVAVYFPWFLIPFLIWGIGFTAHYLVNSGQFTWLCFHWLIYVATNATTFVFWYLGAWHNENWPFFFVPLIPWGIVVVCHAAWVFFVNMTEERVSYSILGLCDFAAKKELVLPSY